LDGRSIDETVAAAPVAFHGVNVTFDPPRFETAR